jgi:hypothetical protein
MTKLKYFTILLILLPTTCFSWGKIGHRTVAQLASLHLTSSAKKEVIKLLGSESMAQASIWPDRIKSDPKLKNKYSHLHYISFKNNESFKKNSANKENILTAIDTFSKILKNKKSPKSEKVIALRFLIHLVGDLHQPLHTGFPQDRGGNKIKVTWFGEKTDLHHIWDDKIIKLEELSYTEYTTKLNDFSKSEIKTWQSSSALTWAKESRNYIPKTYKFKEKKYWEFEYSYKHLGFLNKRLKQAGIRLAGLLNNIFN